MKLYRVTAESGQHRYFKSVQRARIEQAWINKNHELAAGEVLTIEIAPPSRRVICELLNSAYAPIVEPQ